MRFAKLYTFLIVFIGTVSFAAPYGQNQDTLGFNGLGSAHLTVAIDKAIFDLKIALMKKQMESMETAPDRLALMRQTFVEIQEARDQHPMLDDDVEIYMNLAMHSLEALPERSKFDVKYCPYYKREILSNYEPTALTESGEPGTPEDPAIVQSLEILDKICQ